MAISGLAVRIEAHEAARARALAALGARDDLTLGPENGDQIAVVLETPSPTRDRAALDELRALPGVLHVDVIAVFFPEHDPMHDGDDDADDHPHHPQEVTP